MPSLRRPRLRPLPLLVLRPLLALFLLVLLGPLAWAAGEQDVVRTRGGTTLRGQVLDRRDGQLHLRLEDGSVMVIPESEVADVAGKPREAPRPPPPAPPQAPATGGIPSRPGPIPPPVGWPWPPKAAVKGCREVRFGQTTTVSFPGVAGLGVSRSLIGSGNETLFGGELGMGFCLTDLVELGGLSGLSLIHVDTNGSSRNALAIPFVAFLKLNFGNRQSRWNPFVEVAVGGLGLTGFSNTVVANFSTRAGLEIFVRGAWAFFISPGVQVLGDSRDLQVYFRLGWGLSAYF